ncbi:peptidoglycan bridge formation glycyltransferase FemA/FemB family protein [Arthrobacter sp. Br18]|uniref:lipid II:glycine glycyltransferase FemX n=1 Tax=Arthrobacter sp. Br18 TaxID=1312954 RepID=UPI0004B3C614|nr:peptidoglycan bridge formation glycyltransferase FemA/FemB family protein [Arthrobacter sp. Br18]
MSAPLFRYDRLDETEFGALADHHPDVLVPIEQTPAWGRFEAALGRKPFGIWAYRDADGILVATASFLRIQRRLRESLVVVNGPVWFTARTPAAERVLMHTVRHQFRHDDGAAPLYVRMQVATPQLPAAGPLEHGWYEREIVVDLEPDEKALLAGFRPNARNSIRRARKAGVEIRSIPRKEWIAVFREELFPILQETAERDGFSSFDSTYYEAFLVQLADHAGLLVAYQDGRAVSWLITTLYRGHAVYYFAGSTDDARRTFAPYLLLWEAFRALKAAGARSCGLTGIVSENYPQLINVTTFKRNFSKNVVTLPTTYDIPLHPLRYRAVAALLRARRKRSSRG